MKRVGDLVQHGVERSDSRRVAHMHLGGRVSQHRLEVLTASPLRVVRHSCAVQAAVDIGRYETRLVSHHLLSGLDQEADQLVLPLRGTVKLLMSVTTGWSVVMMVVVIPPAYAWSR